MALQLFDGERALTFAPIRHRWTPAWTQTYYCSTPDESYYPNSGCIAIREQKGFNTEDVFVCRIVLKNEKRETARLRVKLITPFEQDEIHLPIYAGALGCRLTLDGFIALLERELTLEIPAHSSVSFALAFAFSKESPACAEKAASAALTADDPFAEKERAFNRFIDDHAPQLICEDTDILKAYYYRWFLLYRALHCPSAVISGHPVEGNCLYESPYGSWYGCPVGLPVPLHLEEAKWMRTGDIARTDADNWLRGLTCYQGLSLIHI